jgi:hypothetical protein
MAGRNPQTHAKRQRELAVKERRERKLAKRAEAAAQRAAGGDAAVDESGGGDSPPADVQDETAATPAPEGADEPRPR